MQIDGATRRATEAQTDRPGRAWFMMGAGLLAGLVGVHLTVVQPTRAQMTEMRRELVAVRSDLDSLVGRRDQIRQANTLLSGLKEQSEQLAASEEALATIRQFRSDVEKEGAKAIDSLAAVDMLSALQETLVENSKATEAANVELDRMIALEKRLAGLKEGATVARDTAERLARIQQTLLYQADRNAAAEYTLRRMIGTQERLIDERQTAEVAANSLAEIADVQAAVIVESARSTEALATVGRLAAIKSTVTAAAKDMDIARKTADSLVTLKTRLATEAKDVDLAQDTAEALVALKATVAAEADDVYVARDTASRLASLRDELAARAEPAQTAAAYEAVDSLVSLRDMLGTDPNKAAAARKNLDVLLSMQSNLAAETQAVIDAVQSLELLADLRGEITTHIEMMEGVRRDLIEIAMMESAVGRAVRVIEPLAKLGDLRRLSNDEIRTAARVILENREPSINGDGSRIQTAVEPVPAPR